MALNKILYLALSVTVLYSVAATPVLAGNWSSPETTSDWMVFVAGIGGAVVTHELGHIAVATGYNYSIHHDGLSITYGPTIRSLREHLRIASAGFQGQWIATEAAFALDSKDSFLAKGVICGHLATTLSYVVVLKNHPQGDTVSIAKSSGLSVNQVAALVSLPALLDAWRLFGHDVPGWIPGLSIALKGAAISAVWTF